MNDALECKILHVTIDRDSAAVYDFLSKPENFPLWAAGLGSVLEHQGEDIWLFQTSMGPTKVRFTPWNDFGIADHFVIPDQGQVIYMPLRVVDNNSASEVQLTLFRQPDMSDAKFVEDEGLIVKDLNALKNLLGNQAHD